MSSPHLSTATPPDVALPDAAACRQLELMFGRFEELIRQASAAAPHWQAQVREEFQCALEELRSNAEQMRAQQAELRAAQDAAARHERRFYDLFNFAPDAYLVTDLSGAVEEMNNAALQMFQLRRSYLAGMPAVSLVLEEDRPLFRREFERLQSEPLVKDLQLRLRSPHREPFAASVTVGHVPSGIRDAPSLRWLIRDITDEKRREEEARIHAAELAHLARLSVLGEMAAGLAHEVNQPLTAITNYARGCLRHIQDGERPARELIGPLTQITQQAERGGEVVRRLRAFVQKRALEFEPTNINDVVRDALVLAEWEVRAHKARLQLHLAPKLPRVAADRIQIEQVLLNLIRNALEAMDEVDAAERLLKIRTEALGQGRVLVAVSDSGPGITPEAHGRLFDPFYTTKCEGMGMGLAICKTILQAHGQTIWATPTEPRGATLNFTLSAELGESA